MKFIFFILLSLFIYSPALSQNTIGIPNIVNYSKGVYGAGNQNWYIAQGKNGIMYFANNNGLLSFDGTFWRTYPLPNKTIVRSLAIADDNKIYVGGQREIGYFYPAKNGELSYTSLNNLLAEQDKDFADIWNISIFKNDVFFRSNRKLFQLADHKIRVYEGINWRFLGMAGTELLAFEFEKGLVQFQNGQWRPCIQQGALPPNIYIRTAIRIGADSILLATFENGLFILHHHTISTFDSPDIKNIATKNIYGACLVSPDKIALITNLAGCIIINREGKFIQRFSKPEGIQNNNVLSVLLDKDNNLWLGLDNGIDLVTYGNAIKNIFPDQEDRNSGYASIIYKNNLYLGISTGVYKIALDSSNKDLSYTKGNFELVVNTKGRVWSLSEVNGHLFAGHNNGGYRIEDGSATVIDNKTGVWGFQALYKQTPSPVVIAGTYSGINFYNYVNGRLLSTTVQALFESARFISIDSNILWIAHPYKGLYKVSFNKNGEPVSSLYPDKKGILSANHNHLYTIHNKTILTSDNGIFEYDHSIQDFKRSVYLEKLFGNQLINYLKEDKYGNIWFGQGNKIGVADLTAATPKVIYIPELNDKILAGGFENINVIDSNNVFIGAEQGFFHLNFAKYKKAKYPLQVLIRKVATASQQDGIIFGGYPNEDKRSTTPAISYQHNSLHFEFSTTLYGQEHNTEFCFYLKGFDKQWSEWGRKMEKDYTNLPAGDYTFVVKCRNNRDNESPVTGYSFTILPPWYQTVWAYILFVLLFLGCLYGFYKRQQRKYKRQQQVKLAEQQRRYLEEQKQLQYLHQLEINETERKIIQLNNEKLQAELEQKNLQEEQERLHFNHQIEVEKNEKEIINLRNEKLQAEITYKNAELASSAMNLVRKMEILSKLKEDLTSFKNHIDGEKGSKEFHKIVRVIDKELDYNQEWEQFAVHFDSVHTNYLKKLKERYPDLTASELKLAAYLRLNLTTKEIAQLMNISIRGVETSRYRLRKKLELDSEVNLFDFLTTITN